MIVEEFFTNLCQKQDIPVLTKETLRGIENGGSYDIPNISIRDMKHALRKAKSDGTPAVDGIVTGGLKLEVNIY